MKNETDPHFQTSAAANVTNAKMTAWDTAAGWGDHDQAGYLKSENDPAFTGSPAAGITAAAIASWNNDADALSELQCADAQVVQWSDALGTFICATVTATGTENDPVFGASAAAGITAAKVGSWDAAAGWGDHGGAGYLKNETDPHFQTSAAANVTNAKMTAWDTAAGWGNHDQAGYLKSETDPQFQASAAASVTAAKVTAWDTAAGWGDHNQAGYLNAEADPQFNIFKTAGGTIGGDITVSPTGASEAWFRAVPGAGQLAGLELASPTNLQHAASLVLNPDAGPVGTSQLQLKAPQYRFAPTSWWGGLIGIHGTVAAVYAGWSATKEGAEAGTEGGVRYEYAGQKLEFLAAGDVRASVDSTGMLVASKFSGDGSGLTNLPEADPVFTAFKGTGGTIANTLLIANPTEDSWLKAVSPADDKVAGLELGRSGAYRAKIEYHRTGDELLFELNGGTVAFDEGVVINKDEKAGKGLTVHGPVSAKCPTGMTQMAGYCIEDFQWPPTTPPHGPGTFFAAVGDCHSRGMELLSLDAATQCRFGPATENTCGEIGSHDVDIWTSSFEWESTTAPHLYLEADGLSFNVRGAARTESKYWVCMTRVYHP